MIAMAGLAEAAIYYGLLIIYGGFWAVAGLLAWSWWKRSLTTVIIGLVIILVAGFLLQPWSAFAPPTSDDPDEAYWIGRFRTASVIWSLLLVATAACLIRVIRHRRFKTDAQTAA
jgi:hypothetical protein